MSESLLYTSAVSFEAARRVDVLPLDHRARNWHGHSFQARVRCGAESIPNTFLGGEVDALTEQLRRAVAPLDYTSLNDVIDVPTDENVARWVRRQLGVSGVDFCGIQSTHDQGADLDAEGAVHIWRRFRFEAAHQLPNVPDGHQCGRMHGHGFEVILHVEQSIGDAEPMGMDFDSLERLWSPLHQELNYQCLNDIEGLDNPTSEMIARWIWQRLKPEVPELSWVTVYETVTAGCHYDGQHYRIWKEQRFESALRLGDAPEGDPRRRLHGHSYVLRLHLAAPLDDVLGWTVDYGDVKERFGPTYEALDHHLLNEQPGIEDGANDTVLRWIRDQVAPLLPELNRIDLFPVPGCGAMLCWGPLGPALPV